MSIEQMSVSAVWDEGLVTVMVKGQPDSAGAGKGQGLGLQLARQKSGFLLVVEVPVSVLLDLCIKS